MQIEASGSAFQNLAPPGAAQRFEGVAFSSSGRMLAVAAADSDTVYLFRRGADGRFEEAPYRVIGGPGSGIEYPHDLAFAKSGDTELLAIVQRAGSIALYAGNAGDGEFTAEPVFEIHGPETGLGYSDGIAFVPPHNDHLAVCNARAATVTFYRRTPGPAIGFELKPDFELRHRAINHPDGLSFSGCGRWLALANHGNHTVSVFARRNMFFTGGKLKYGPRPVTVIRDPGLRFTHSVAFTPVTGHIVVSSAGANHFTAYQPLRGALGMRWAQQPVLRQAFIPDQVFAAANGANDMEGGPKGIAIHGSSMAICSPECGVNIYSFRE